MSETLEQKLARSEASAQMWFDITEQRGRRIDDLAEALKEAERLLVIAYYAGLKLGLARQEPDASLPHEVRMFAQEFHGEDGGPLHKAAKAAQVLLQRPK